MSGNEDKITSLLSEGKTFAPPTEGADKVSLAEGYGVLIDEIERAAPGHEIKSINSDGYSSTSAALREVWGSSVVLITCILHLFIALRDGCKRKYKEQFEGVADGFWYCYEAETKSSFVQRWRAFIKAISGTRNEPSPRNSLNINRYFSPP